MRTILSILALILAASPLNAASPVFGWGDTDVKYAQDKRPQDLSSAVKTYDYSAWRGERINMEAVIWAESDLSGLTLSATPLVCGKAVIPASSLKASFVDYVIGDKLVYEYHQCGCRDTVNFQRMTSPDIIGRSDTVSLASGKACPVWLSVDVPFDAAAGTYKGKITLSQGGKPLKTLSYRVKVIDRVLTPARFRPFHLDLWQNPYSVARYHNVPLWSKEHFDCLRPVMENLARAGQKVVTATIMDRPWNGQTEDPFCSMVTKILRSDGSWAYDYTAFDKWVEFMASVGISEQINCYTLIPWALKFDYFDQATGTVKYIEAAPGSDEYSWYWAPFIRDFARHLRAKGWFEKTCIAMDERPEDSMKAAEALVHSVEPQMKISLAGNYHESVADRIYDLCIPMYSQYPEGALERRRAAGQISTIYHCCSENFPNIFIDSRPAEACWCGWMALAAGADGFLRWAANSWTVDPFKDARFRTWAAGDTYCLYPDGVSSVRFERFCEGLQDYEKARLLIQEWSEDPAAKDKLEKLQGVLSRFGVMEIAQNGPVPLLREARMALEAAGNAPVAEKTAYERENIWPAGKMPDAQSHQIAAMRDEAEQSGFKPEKHTQPYLEWYEAPDASTDNDCCMILISGGSYENCYDVDLIENWHRDLTALGFQCVNLVYRTPRPVGLPIYQSAWEDGQRAVRMVRSQAAQRGFDPEKIGIISMSAGSHLGLLLATSSQTPAYQGVDALDEVPCHINWAIVNAPGYGTTDCLTGMAARQGYGPDVQLSDVFKFDEKTCPMTLQHGGLDPYGPAVSPLVYCKLRQMGIPAELHLYPDKGHGAFGFERTVEFMRQMGFMGELEPEVALMERYPSDEARAIYQKEPVWPDGKMPDAQEQQCEPYLEWHIPAVLKTNAIQIIYSGGSYMGNDPDGFEVAPARRYLNALGMTVVTLRYRCPRPSAESGLAKHTSAWEDLQRAIRVVRSEAASKGLDPERIGIMGSSAGGHLTLMGVTSSRHQSYLPIDDIDKLPCNVQWGIAIYPAYALTDGLDWNPKTGGNLLGGNDESAVLAPEFSFDLDTCPVLFVHGDADEWAAMNSVKAWEKMREIGVQSELHTLAMRRHCFQQNASPGTGSYTYLERISEFLGHEGIL